MAASMRPAPPANSPFIIDRPLKVPIKVIPMITMMKSSGEPKRRTSGRMIGMDRARASAPTTEPIRELMIAAPKALPASPFFDIG